MSHGRPASARAPEGGLIAVATTRAGLRSPRSDRSEYPCVATSGHSLTCRSENAWTRLNRNSTPVDDTDMRAANGPPTMGDSNPSHLTSKVR